MIDYALLFLSLAWIPLLLAFLICAIIAFLWKWESKKLHSWTARIGLACMFGLTYFMSRIPVGRENFLFLVLIVGLMSYVHFRSSENKATQ